MAAIDDYRPVVANPIINIDDGGFNGVFNILNPFALMFMSHFNPLFRVGSKRPLELVDLGLVRKEERVDAIYEVFSKYWALECKLPKDKR